MRLRPTMGYIAQLEVPHPRLREMADHTLASPLRLPDGAVPSAALFNVDRVGGPKVRSADAAMRAAIFSFSRGNIGKRGEVHRWLRRNMCDAPPLSTIGLAVDAGRAPGLRAARLETNTWRASIGWGSSEVTAA